jgi:hypothetical protein
VLRVHDLGLARGEAEEGGVEAVGLLQRPLGPHVARVGQQGRIDPGSGQLLLGEDGDRLDPFAQVAPELGGVAGPGKTGGEAHDGDTRFTHSNLSLAAPALAAHLLELP